MRTHPLLLPLLGAMIVVAGCGGPKLAPVTGTLKMDGKPLKNVKVDFQPDPDKGTRGAGSAGTTDEQGNFTLTSSAKGNPPGAIAGHHRIILTDLDTYGTVFVGRGNYRAEDGKGGTKEVPKLARFPTRYSDLAQTPLKQEVKEGMSPVTIEIKK